MAVRDVIRVDGPRVVRGQLLREFADAVRRSDPATITLLTLGVEAVLELDERERWRIQRFRLQRRWEMRSLRRRIKIAGQQAVGRIERRMKMQHLADELEQAQEGLALIAAAYFRAGLATPASPENIAAALGGKGTPP